MKLTNINKSYGERKVLTDFSLQLNAGEILCLLGPSGAGKTTILNVLAGLVPFDGEVQGATSEVAYVFQEPRLLPNLTVKQNLAFVGGAPQRIEELLVATELSTYACKRPSELSGGERQRVSLARAFCVPFDLLLLDEPFSSLDTALKIRLAEVFARLWKETEDRTAVFVTHDLEEALMLADRVVVLKDGNIACDLKIKKGDFPAPYGRPCEERQKLLSVLLNNG